MHVRQLTTADVEVYRTLRLQGLRDHPQAFGADADEEAAWSIDDWMARLQRRFTFGAFVGDTLVGTAALSTDPGRKHGHRGCLVGMYVAPAARGTGAARALVAAVLERARGRVETVELGVGIANAPAIELYLTCGFRPYAIDADAVRVDGMPVDEVLMRRTV